MRKLLFLFFIVCLSTVFTQQVKVTQDFGLWAGVGVEHKMKDFKINFSNQIRTFNNSLKVDDYLVDFGLKYTINKNFKLHTNIRYIYDLKRWKLPENNFRYQLGISFRVKFYKKFKITYKVGYQQEFVNLLSEYKTKKINFSDVRNKIKLQYRIHEIHKLYASAELFLAIEPQTVAYFDKIRFFIGDNIYTKIGSLDVSLGFQQEINTSLPYSFFFLKTIYTFKLWKRD